MMSWLKIRRLLSMRNPAYLPEINGAHIQGANVVAAPGCYPTTSLLGLYPLLKNDVLVENSPIIVDAKSGVSTRDQRRSYSGCKCCRRSRMLSNHVPPRFVSAPEK